MSAQFPSTMNDDHYKMVIHIFYENETSRKGNTESKKYNNPTSLESTIVLPLPNQIQDSQGHNWSEYSIVNSLSEYSSGGSSILSSLGGGGKIGNIISGISGAIDTMTSAINTDSVINKISRRGFGTGLDPNWRLEYLGESLRDFTFNFTFIPESKKDTENIVKIIKELRKYSTGSKSDKKANPDSTVTTIKETIVSALKSADLAVNAFITEPASFMINFQSKTNKKTVINDMFRPMKLVLTGMSTSLFEEGYASLFKDGAPKSVSLTLNFKEQYPLYSEDWD